MQSREVVTGDVVIEWPKGNHPAPHLTRITDAATGELLALTTAIVLHMDCAMPDIYADLTMLCDADGEAVREGQAVPTGPGGVWPVTRRWRVAEFR